eukprot:g2151.t1
MKAGVVHQLAISLNSLVVDLDATNRSPIAMALIRAERLHVVVSRDGKKFLSVHAGNLVHSSLNFEPTAQFSKRVTLYENVRGEFQPKLITIAVFNDDMPDQTAMSSICKATMNIAEYAESAGRTGEPTMTQVRFEKGTALLFLSISCVRTDADYAGGGGREREAFGHKLNLLPAGWRSAVDPKSKRKYYYNETTGLTSWDRPVWSEVKRSVSTKSPSKTKDDAVRSLTLTTDSRNSTNLVNQSDWKSAVDPNSQRTYIYNTKTGERRWKDAVSPSLGHKTPTKISVLTSSEPCHEHEQQQNLHKYQRMLKAGVPLAAVQAKATQDGVSLSDIDAISSTRILNSSGRSGGTSATRVSSSRRDPVMNQKLLKYQQMIKAGVPVMAVRAKAAQEGVSQSDIDALCDGKGGGVSGPMAPQTQSPKVISQQNPKLAKYQAMLKAGVPLPAVCMKAQQDGLSASDISALQGGRSQSSDSPRGHAPPPGFRKDNGLTKLHWKRVDESRLKASIWASPNLSDMGIDAHEEEHLRSTFAASKKGDRNLRKNRSGGTGKRSKIKKKKQILDAKRCHNVEISLAKFRDFSSYQDVADAINNLDLVRLRPDILHLFDSVLPNADETRKLQAFAKDHSLSFSSERNSSSSLSESEIGLRGLCKAEKFMLTLACQVRLRGRKVETILFLSGFSDTISQLRGNMNLVLTASQRVFDSEDLVVVLRKVLAVGNAMNRGSHVGEVPGFTLESLPRLWSTKGNDKRTTVLDFVVRMLLERDPHLADLPKTLALLSTARNVQKKDLLTQVRQLQLKYEKQQKYHEERLFEIPRANADYGKRLREISTSINSLVSLKDIFLSSAERLAAYWGEDISSCAPEKVFGTLHEFCAAFNRSVLAFKQTKLAEKRGAKSARKKGGRAVKTDERTRSDARKKKGKGKKKKKVKTESRSPASLMSPGEESFMQDWISCIPEHLSALKSAGVSGEQIRAVRKVWSTPSLSWSIVRNPFKDGRPDLLSRAGMTDIEVSNLLSIPCDILATKAKIWVDKVHDEFDFVWHYYGQSRPSELLAEEWYNKSSSGKLFMSDLLAHKSRSSVVSHGRRRGRANKLVSPPLLGVGLDKQQKATLKRMMMLKLKGFARKALHQHKAVVKDIKGKVDSHEAAVAAHAEKIMRRHSIQKMRLQARLDKQGKVRVKKAVKRMMLVKSLGMVIPNPPPRPPGAAANLGKSHKNGIFFDRAKEDGAAALLQAVMRGHLARKKLKTMSKAVLKIQALYRGAAMRAVMGRALENLNDQEAHYVRTALNKAGAGFIASLTKQLDPDNTGTLGRPGMVALLEKFQVTHTAQLLRQMGAVEPSCGVKSQIYKTHAGGGAERTNLKIAYEGLEISESAFVRATMSKAGPKFLKAIEDQLDPTGCGDLNRSGIIALLRKLKVKQPEPLLRAMGSPRAGMAIKRQAFRDWLAGKNTKYTGEKRGDNSGKKNELETVHSTEVMNKAATKIQALRRGFKIRRLIANGLNLAEVRESKRVRETINKAGWPFLQALFRQLDPQDTGLLPKSGIVALLRKLKVEHIPLIMRQLKHKESPERWDVVEKAHFINQAKPAAEIAFFEAAKWVIRDMETSLYRRSGKAVENDAEAISLEDIFTEEDEKKVWDQAFNANVQNRHRHHLSQEDKIAVETIIKKRRQIYTVALRNTTMPRWIGSDYLNRMTFGTYSAMREFEKRVLKKDKEAIARLSLEKCMPALGTTVRTVFDWLQDKNGTLQNEVRAELLAMAKTEGERVNKDKLKGESEQEYLRRLRDNRRSDEQSKYGKEAARIAAELRRKKEEEERLLASLGGPGAYHELKDYRTPVVFKLRSFDKDHEYRARWSSIDRRLGRNGKKMKTYSGIQYASDKNASGFCVVRFTLPRVGIYRVDIQQRHALSRKQAWKDVAKPGHGRAPEPSTSRSNLVGEHDAANCAKGVSKMVSNLRQVVEKSRWEAIAGSPKYVNARFSVSNYMQENAAQKEKRRLAIEARDERVVASHFGGNDLTRLELTKRAQLKDTGHERFSLTDVNKRNAGWKNTSRPTTPLELQTRAATPLGSQDQATGASVGNTADWGWVE